MNQLVSVWVRGLVGEPVGGALRGWVCWCVGR